MSIRYSNELVTLKCSPDLLALRIYPNYKEWCESSGMHLAVRRFWPDMDYSDRSIIAYCPGDGTTPRTAAMFAFRSAWTVHSIDPNLNFNKSIKRLTLWKMTAEDFEFKYTSHKAYILATHAHINLKNFVSRALNHHEVVRVVSMPCCYKDKQTLNEVGLYLKDKGIPSDKNEIFGWELKKNLDTLKNDKKELFLVP